MHQLRATDIHGLPHRAADSCLARAVVREEGGGVITIGEYIAWRQPDVAAILQGWRKVEQHSLQWWARLMTERPLPGRAGLLPGEKAV